MLVCLIGFMQFFMGGLYLYLYLLRNSIIMHRALKWHKEHEDLTISVPGLSGLLMDRWCIQILVVNTQSPFYYI